MNYLLLLQQKKASICQRAQVVSKSNYLLLYNTNCIYLNGIYFLGERIMFDYKPIDYWHEIMYVELVDDSDGDYQQWKRQKSLFSNFELEDRYQKWCDLHSDLTDKIRKMGIAYEDYLGRNVSKGFCAICDYHRPDNHLKNQFCCRIKKNKGLQDIPERYSKEICYTKSCEYFNYKRQLVSDTNVKRCSFIWLVLGHDLAKVKPPQKKEILSSDPPFKWAYITRKTLFDYIIGNKLSTIDKKWEKTEGKVKYAFDKFSKASFCPTILKIQRYGHQQYFFKKIDFLIKYLEPESLLLIECKLNPRIHNSIIQLNDYVKLLQMTSFFYNEKCPLYTILYSDWGKETKSNDSFKKRFEPLLLDQLETKKQDPHILFISTFYENNIDELFDDKQKKTT